MDTTQKQLKQLEAKVDRLEKIVQRLANYNRSLDVEVRRLKHADRQAQHQIATLERKLSRGGE